MIRVSIEAHIEVINCGSYMGRQSHLTPPAGTSQGEGRKRWGEKEEWGWEEMNLDLGARKHVAGKASAGYRGVYLLGGRAGLGAAGFALFASAIRSGESYRHVTSKKEARRGVIGVVLSNSVQSKDPTSVCRIR